uniref:Uncharacterized protein n=1 Tax=Arundo donax TaxID=35708 RepID=A0A0A9BYQ8_ARUDO
MLLSLQFVSQSS